MPWLRMREDENYWCAYNETPNAPMGSFMHEAKGQAPIGHLVIVKGAKDFTFDAFNRTGFQTYHVTGTKGMNAGIAEVEVKSGDHDEDVVRTRSAARVPPPIPAGMGRAGRELRC
jgi:hypothetical protein